MGFATHGRILLGAAAVLAATLPGCGLTVPRPARLPRTATVRPEIGPAAVRLSDGTMLHALTRIQEPALPVLVCVHGLGGHAGLFRDLADLAAARSFSVVAPDLRGFGHWYGERGAIDNLGVYVDDLHDVITAVRARLPGRPIVLLGESLGASLVAWYAAELPGTAAGLVLVNAVSNPTPSSQLTPSGMLAGAVGFLFYPDLRIDITIDPRQLTSDPAWVRALESDPYVAQDVPFRFLIQAGTLIRRTPELLGRVDVPVLMFQSGEDIFSDDEGARALLAAAGSEDRTYVFEPRCRHTLLNDVCGERATITTLEWARTLDSKLVSGRRS